MFWTLKLNFCYLFISKHYITEIFVWFSRIASSQQQLIWSLFKFTATTWLISKSKKNENLGLDKVQANKS